MHHADRMSEPAVVGPWKNKLTYPELLDPPQPLKFPGVDQIPEQPIARLILE
jgi:hypothetical protein